MTGSSWWCRNGGDVTCTINNNDQPAQLTLVKTVTNDNGGTAVPTDWTLTATGPTPISGTIGPPRSPTAPVNAGSYALSESAGPAGYTAGHLVLHRRHRHRLDRRRAARRRRHLHDQQQRRPAPS